MTDAEIRGKLLKHFHQLRHNNGGRVPLSDTIMSPEPVSLQVLGSVCDQLADVGLIEWKPLRTGAGLVAGNAKITGRGVEAVEAGRSDEIELRFPGVDASSPPSAPTAGNEAAPDAWLSAAETLALLGGDFTMRKTICARAHAGLIRARARRLVVSGTATDDVEIPAAFWWAKGEAALEQNWKTGDFDTWIAQTQHLQAFGVTFYRADITPLVQPVSAGEATSPTKATGGRPKASWNDDLWVEMCRQLFVGDLQPRRQADITKAMMDWLAAHGHDAAESTIKDRARKLWAVIGKDEK